MLAEIDADVVALQEADRRFGLRMAAIPPTLLEHHSDYRAVPLNRLSDSMGWHGNAVLVRKSAQVTGCEALHIPCLEPRGAVMAEVEHDGMAVRLFGMHLDLSGLWRRKQASAIVHAASQLPPMPTLLMGDLNEWSAARGCLADFARHYEFATCGRSYHASRPIARLDRIMHSSELTLIDSGVHASATARHASDHLPVWADFQLK